jgi:toxin-antitoxin system PIN domain toxin
MLVDANLLLYAVDVSTPQHEAAAGWLAGVLSGPRRVGLPWQSLGAFLRISTHPRAAVNPLAPAVAWSHVAAWLGAGPAWIPEPSEGYAEILGSLVTSYGLAGNLVTDGQLAALAIAHGLTLYSADTDFARFRELAWENPLAT